MHGIKVGDKVRLTGKSWDTDYGDEVSVGGIVEVDEVDISGIWAWGAGTVGNRNGLYSANNPEPSGDYSCELVSLRTSHEGMEDLAKLGDQLGIYPSSFEGNVHRITDQIADLLIEKNRAYGDSALNPIRVFSKVDRMEQLFIRLDDKLSRIQRGHEYPGDDTIRDIMGYCALILIAKESE